MIEPALARDVDNRLSIFISHAAEDMDLARTLQNAIEQVCDSDQNVEVFLDYNHIKFGAPIPTVIKDALSRSHFFIGIATHNLRNQFSWCGLELGYFLSARAELEVCYLYHKEVQDVFRPYLGTQVTSLHERHVAALSSPVESVTESAIYRLLVQIGIESSKRSFPKDPIKFFDSLRTAAHAGAIAITDAYVDQLSRNAKQARYPQGRIKVTIEGALNQISLPTLINKASVSIYPKAASALKIPGSSEESPAEMEWGVFNDRMKEPTGGPCLSSILYEIIDAFLPAQYDAKNDYLCQAPENHTFRVILVRYERYGDDLNEFVFNLIETLEPLKGGDPRTTLITSAIVMATQFRSLFIEHDATYSADVLAASPDLLTLTKEIARDLRRIHIESSTLRLNEDALKKALGSSDQIHDWHTKWWPPVLELEDTAQKFIENQTNDNRSSLLRAHQAMIEQTRDINRKFTSLCLKVYKEIIDGTGDQD